MSIASAKLRQRIQQALDSVTTEGDIANYRLAVLRKSLFKKYLGTPEDEDALHLHALKRFKDTCDRISSFNRHFKPDDITRRIRDEFTLVFQSEDPLDLFQCVSRGKCGPGASIGDANQNDFLSKMFVSDLSHTKEPLFRYYRAIIDDRWLSAELFRAERHPTNVVRGSRITTVPKDEQRRRTICTEPILNMFYQLGAKAFLEDLLKRHHNIDVSTQQDINRRMAREGSITGRFATIDLSDASDSISTSLVQYVLPKDAYHTLDLIRSHEAQLGNDGEWLQLPMFSTMGNGFTFVLMTLLFSCVVRSVYHKRGITPKAGRNYAVFGDDIIVDTNLYPEVISTLQHLGFIPNADKSFNEGFFRESCGGDYYHGYNVRGVYCKGLNNEADLYSLFNRLLRWSCSSGIDLSPVLVEIHYELRGRRVCFVPPDLGDNSGIKIPSELADPPLSSGMRRYHYLCPVSRRVGVERLFGGNSDGAITAFIGGYIRRGRVALRCENVKYQVRRGKTPAWDRRVVWNDLCSSFSSIEGWAPSESQEAVSILSKVLTLGAMRRLELLV